MQTQHWNSSVDQLLHPNVRFYSVSIQLTLNQATFFTLELSLLTFDSVVFASGTLVAAIAAFQRASPSGLRVTPHR